jgi:hypothetical protein
MSDRGEKGHGVRGVVVCLATIALLAAIYVGSYFALMAPIAFQLAQLPPVRGFRVPIVSEEVRRQHFRYGGTAADSAFWPLTQLDKLVRPDYWGESDTLLGHHPISN